jgi:hypothetical protein
VSEAKTLSKYILLFQRPLVLEKAKRWPLLICYFPVHYSSVSLLVEEKMGTSFQVQSM